jgi:hypothetical protein
MIRKIVKKVGNKTFVINIPVVDYQSAESAGAGSGINNIVGEILNLTNVIRQIAIEIFTTTEDNNYRITEDGLLYRVLE